MLSPTFNSLLVPSAQITGILFSEFENNLLVESKSFLLFALIFRVPEPSATDADCSEINFSFFLVTVIELVEIEFEFELHLGSLLRAAFFQADPLACFELFINCQT